jgi:MFS family permease
LKIEFNLSYKKGSSISPLICWVAGVARFGNFIRGFSEVLIMAASDIVASVLIPHSSQGRMFALFNAIFFISWGLAGTLIAGPIVDYFMRLKCVD